MDEVRNGSTNETLSYLASAFADAGVASLTEAVGRVKERDIFLSSGTGYVDSTISTVRELFSREWVIPCIKTRLAL